MKTDNPSQSLLPSLKRLWKASFGDSDAFIDRFFAVAFAPERCLCIADGDEVLAAAYWFDVTFSQQKGAYVYAVATAEAHRGKGLCRKLMDSIHTHLQTRGYEAVLLVPGNPQLREMYGKMGYVNFGGIREFACIAGDAPLKVKEISAEDFAAARRTRLPAGGVVQEGENLRFLEQFYRFYQGGDCLLAAASTGSELFAAEFWGDAADAPGLLAGLGAQSGVFRTAGQEAFGMYHPLGNNCAPAYFAFAFD